MDMEVNNNNVTEEVKKPAKKKSTAKAIPVNINKVYLKGQEFEETINFDLSDTHSHKIDCVVFESQLNIKGELITIMIKWNRSRSNYQTLVCTSQGNTSLSFFPHFDHAKKAAISFIERMI